MIARLQPLIVLLSFLALALVIAYLGRSPELLAISMAIVVVGHIAASLARMRIEGTLGDERLEYISLNAKAQAYDSLLVTIGAYWVLSKIISGTGGTPLHQWLEPDDLIGLVALLALIFFALSYLINARRAGGL